MLDSLIDIATIDGSMNCCPTLLDDDNSSESTSLTEFVTSQINSSANFDVIKIISAAMQIASEAGIVETRATSPLQTAMTAVDITKQLNVSYLIDQGEILATNAANQLIDQATANAYIVAENALSPENLNLGINAALDSISVSYPPIATVAQFSKQFSPYIAEAVSPTIKHYVKDGIKVVSAVAHTVAERTVSKVSSLVRDKARTVTEMITSFFK